MPTNRWQETERIFLAALDLPAAERSALLDREAAHDPELRAAVEGMLRHAGDGGTRIQGAVARAAAALPVEPPPIHIEKFTIVRELGRGGMGTVYLAERAAAEFRQQVAIKVVTHGLGSAQLVERFRQERRILAALDHPNIARLLDGGATDQGVPYLVMEHVEGRPLIEYSRERHLPVRARLLLFEQVCAAVQHAHQKLVVHRDIKPGNILVTAAGVPKLLDFGIAKLLHPDDATAELTRTGMHPFTPAYASPEQVRGEPVTVATDIYSLGAVLYELLAGVSPHRIRNGSPADLELAICETMPQPPSEAVSDRRIRRELAGDLDNIVALALRKDPARRYVSVEQFAGDICRFLEGRPVRARPETLAYRAGKFVLRNRIAVAAGVLAVVSLTAGIVAATLQARRADAQAARAERRFQQVRKLANTFVFGIYDGMVNVPGTAKIRAEVVTTATEYLDSLAREAEDDTALQLELAAAYKRIGDVQGNPGKSGLGQTRAAIASYGKAAAILERLARRENPDPKVLADLAVLERTTGFVQLQLGDPARAVSHQSRSVAAWERRNPRRGQNLEADTGIAQAWGIMGQALLGQGDAAAAVEKHTAAVDLLRRWPSSGAAPVPQGTFSLMLHDLAEARRDTGDLAGAVAAYQESVRICEKFLAANPRNFTWRRRRFLLHFSLATVSGNPLSFHLGQSEAAESYAGLALREAEALADEDRGSARSERDRLFGHWVMGCVLLPRNPRRALPYLETALQMAPAGDQLEANAQEALARALLKTGDRRRALDLLRRAAATLERLSGDAPRFIDYRFDLIRVGNLLGDTLPPAEGAAFYRKAFQALDAQAPGDRNTREHLSRAESSFRWARWNPGAPAVEKRRHLERAVGSWSKLGDRAPGNLEIQRNLAEARRLLAALP